MSKKRGLGKGLDALIPAGTGAAMPGEGVAQVPVEAIRPNPRQPRESMDTQALEDLAQSIREHGVLQPLIVLPADAQGSYTLIAGERRLRAAAMAGLKEVPAIIREATEAQRLELALIENLQRSDLNPLEAAEGYRQLAEDFGLSHEEIATRVGKKISEGHARALLALPTAQAQSAALQGILSRELNVRQTEELVRSMLGERPRRKKKVPDRSAEEVALEEELRQALGTKVTLRRGRRGGRLVLHFYSDEELNALVEQLLAQAKKD